MNDREATGAAAEEILSHYDAADEATRLDSGLGLVERERTRRLVADRLPGPPGVVLDIGCGAGVHAVWLARAGYEVHASDPVPKHVAQASAAAAAAGVELASAAVGHAGALAHDDGSADAVLALGPLYHLPEPAARAAALREATRVLRPGGWFFGAAISRFTSMVNAFNEALFTDAEFTTIVRGDLGSGQHRNTSGNPAYFTTAFAHHPDELSRELGAAGLVDIEVLAIEGLAWSVPDIDAVWTDEVARAELLELLALTEGEPTLCGASTHLLGIGRRPDH